MKSSKPSGKKQAEKPSVKPSPKPSAKPSAKSTNFRSSRALYLLGMLTIAVVYLCAYTKTFDRKPDIGGDNISYYALGSALAAGKGYTSTMGLTEVPHNHYPPGYPFIISLAIRAGAGIIGVKILNGIFLLLSCCILYHLFYRTAKNVYIAFFVTLLVALNSHLLRSATTMMSEIPFLLFTSLTLLLFSFLLDRKKCDGKYLLLLLGTAAGAVASYYIRSAGIALILALVVTLAVVLAAGAWKNRKSGWRSLASASKPLWIALIAIAAFFLLCKLPWDMRSRRHGFKSSYMSQLSVQQGGTHITDLNGWIDRVKKNAVRYATKEIPSGLLMEPVDYDKPAGAKGWTLGAALLLAMAAGLLQLKKNDLLLFFYVGGTAVVLLFWPDIWFSPRFMIPIIPILLLLMLTGLVKAGELLLALLKIKARGVATVAALAVVCLFVYPNGTLALSRAATESKHKSYNATNAAPMLVEFLDAIRWVRDSTPKDALVCTRKPEIFYLYSGGRKSSSFPNYATPEEIVTFLADRKISYVIIDRWFRHAYVTIIPAAQKYPDRFRIVWQTPNPEKDAPLTYVLEFM
jgi:4-amino-4-deoxy-L-arabinose transferase-like glycosyltransferase